MADGVRSMGSRGGVSVEAPVDDGRMGMDLWWRPWWCGSSWKGLRRISAAEAIAALRVGVALRRGRRCWAARPALKQLACATNTRVFRRGASYSCRLPMGASPQLRAQRVSVQQWHARYTMVGGHAQGRAERRRLEVFRSAGALRRGVGQAATGVSRRLGGSMFFLLAAGRCRVQCSVPVHVQSTGAKREKGR
jgi:hypothetical protein